MAITRPWGILLGVLACYCVGFFWFYPGVVTVSDEASYLLQAKYFAQGRLRAPAVDPMTGETTLKVGSEYPVGTSLLIAPFFLAGGLRGAFLFPLVMLAAAVLLTAKWLEEAGHSPAWAILVLGYAPTLALGRIPMSDLPSAVVVALGYWCFWKGIAGPKQWWLWSGGVAGLSLLFRETNILLFAILFAGALLRRERQWSLLCVGGAAGAALRPLSAAIMFGDPLFHKAVLPGFGLDLLGRNLLIYGIALLIFFPGGLLASVFYAGPRKTELQWTTFVFVAFYIVYQYSGAESGFLKSLILGPRFCIPLTPLLAFQMADVAPRLWKRLEARWTLPAGRRSALLAASVAGVAVAALGVNWGMARYTKADAMIRAECARQIPEQSVVIGNSMALRKYLNGVYGEYTLLDFRFAPPDLVERLLRRESRIFFVTLARRQSEFWQAEHEQENAYLQTLQHPVTVVSDHHIDAARHLTIGVMQAPQH